MNKTTRYSYQAAAYILTFMVIQMACTALTMLFFKGNIKEAVPMIISSAASSAFTIVLFAWLKWSPPSRKYINTRPWGTLFWAACLSIGSVVPASLLQEGLGLELPETYAKMFTGIMSNDWGYLCIGLLVPVAEEMVFRGAVLRKLLCISGSRLRWASIAASALLFAIFHGNMAQGVNAFLLGLILGWLYTRTGSIVPGIVFHWMNNTCAFATFRLMPGTADMTVTQFYGGDVVKISLATVCSLAIFFAALYQLRTRLPKDGFKNTVEPDR